MLFLTYKVPFIGSHALDTGADVTLVPLACGDSCPLESCVLCCHSVASLGLGALIIQGQIQAYFSLVCGAYLVISHSPIHLTGLPVIFKSVFTLYVAV